MKYVILNGMYEGDSFLQKINDLLSKELQNKGLEGESIALHEKNIKPCLGCFKCWVETPGMCIIDDEGREVARKMIQTDIMIYLTPIIYGGYSSELKKALDRSIGLMTPFFQIYHDEIHHVTRYEKYPNMTVFGVLDKSNPEQEEIFSTLVKRNSLNNFASKFESTIIYLSDDQATLQSKIQSGLEIVGEESG